MTKNVTMQNKFVCSVYPSLDSSHDKKMKRKKEDDCLWRVSHRATAQSFEERSLQLGLVGVGPRVGHAEDSPAGVRQVGPKLILERFSPEGFASWET